MRGYIGNNTVTSIASLYILNRTTYSGINILIICLNNIIITHVIAHNFTSLASR